MFGLKKAKTQNPDKNIKELLKKILTAGFTVIMLSGVITPLNASQLDNFESYKTEMVQGFNDYKNNGNKQNVISENEMSTKVLTVEANENILNNLDFVGNENFNDMNNKENSIDNVKNTIFDSIDKILLSNGETIGEHLMTLEDENEVFHFITQIEKVIDTEVIEVDDNEYSVEGNVNAQKVKEIINKTFSGVEVANDKDIKIFIEKTNKNIQQSEVASSENQNYEYSLN